LETQRKNWSTLSDAPVERIFLISGNWGIFSGAKPEKRGAGIRGWGEKDIAGREWRGNGRRLKSIDPRSDSPR
jgi:hypothetical protein